VAKRTYTQLIDDIDGGEAAETVSFALDGSLFEIDLSEKNANRFRDVLAPYTAAGTRVGRTGVITRGRMAPAARPAASSTPAGANRDRNAEIRAWAAEKGIEISDRGRIKQEIVDQWEAERHGGASIPTQASVRGTVARGAAKRQPAFSG